MDFDKVVADIYPWILSIARKYCRTRQDAEDLAGETIVKMLVNRDKFDISKPIKPWCIAVMRNIFITIYNRNSIVHFIDYDSISECKSSSNACDMVVFHDVISVIHQCLKRSCCVECAIFYAKGYTYDEISELLNVPVGTVRSRISYARKMINVDIGK